jgi:hypothetical protein
MMQMWEREQNGGSLRAKWARGLENKHNTQHTKPPGLAPKREGRIQYKDKNEKPLFVSTIHPVEPSKHTTEETKIR